MGVAVIPQVSAGRLMSRAMQPASRLAGLTVEEMTELLNGVAAPSLKIKQGMTFPPVQAYLTDVAGPYDLTLMSALEFAMKGVTIGPLVQGAATSLQTAFTVTTSSDSPTLSSVSSFTGLFGPLPNGALGSILIGANIPPPELIDGEWVCTTVLALNPTASTITMSANATNAGTAQATVGNKGLSQYTITSGNWDTLVPDTYLVEWMMDLTSPAGAILFFPSESDLNQTIEIDEALGET